MAMFRSADSAFVKPIIDDKSTANYTKIAASCIRRHFLFVVNDFNLKYGLSIFLFQLVLNK